MFSIVALPRAFSRSELLKATADDEVLVEVIKMVQGKSYKKIENKE